MTEPAVTEAAATDTARTAPSPGCPPPHPAPRKPALALPPGSCDAHCHIFGPAAVFPYAPDRTFTPSMPPRSNSPPCTAISA